MRLVVLSAVVCLVALITPASAAETWRTQFDAAVYGDVTVVGNAVLTCPTPAQAGTEPKYPPQSCMDGQRLVGDGPGALNNGHRMVWTDVDGDATTFNSSSARVAIPAGAEIAYAKLGWAGNVRCGEATPPPGEPRGHAVTLRVNGTATRVAPESFTADDPGGLAGTDYPFYSAEADVTRAIRGSATVVVGNVWTPQGFDCFGGWSLTVVWKFAEASAAAPAQRRVSVHGGHVRMSTGRGVVRTKVAPTRAAGGVTRIGITAYEGDWATGGDRLLVNGSAVGGKDQDNFFVSAAGGASVPNNMSVDARTVTVLEDTLPPGAKSAELTFSRNEDAFLVQSLALSFPLPELVLRVDPDQLAAHPRDRVTQTATVTNAGDAPASGVVVCGQQVGTLAPHAAATRTCTSTAADDDYRATADANGTSLAGDPLAATATTPVDVLHPALKATTTPNPATVLPGQSVRLTTTVTNTGDTPLSGITARSSLGDCGAATAMRLDLGSTSTVDCAVRAGEQGGAVTVTVAGTDRIGAAVEAQATAAFTVIHPRLTIAVAWSTDKAAAGEPVTLTVTVGNPSDLRFTDVQVEGEPASCHRTVPVLEPRQRITYTCQAAAPLSARLTVSGGPTGTALVVGDSAPVRIGSAPPAEQPVVRPTPAAHATPVSKPAVGGVAAVLGTVGMMVVVSALSGLGRR